MVSDNSLHRFLFLKLISVVNDFRLDSNAEAEVEEMKSKKKQLEETVTPIISKLYAGAGGEAGGEPATDSSKDEL